MAHHVVAYRTDILRDHIAPALDESVRTGGQRQVDRRTRGSTERDHARQVRQTSLSRETGSEDDIHDVTLDLLVQINLTNHVTGVEDLLFRQDRLDLRTFSGYILAYDQFLLLLLRVIDDHLQHETVYLRLR